MGRYDCVRKKFNMPRRSEETVSQFDQVSVIKKANVFFNGGVTSRTVIFADGSKKTLGIMQPGQYEFTTQVKEIMEFYSGELSVLLPGQSEWKPIRGGMEFEVPANATFKLDVKQIADYCCSFLSES